MGSLIGSLSTALSSLLAQQGAMEVTANNIANANTPGYERQQAVLSEGAAVTIGSLSFGTGVNLENVQTVRDQVLNRRIQQETQSQSQLNAFLGGANQAQALFNETQGVGLQNDLSSFFNSLRDLSADPTSLTLRQTVMNDGQNLADAFHQASSGLSQIQNGLDQEVPQVVTQVNQLSSQIAALNGQITAAQFTMDKGGALQSQRDTLLQNLSNLVGVSVTNDSDGSVTVTAGNGAALVVGTQSVALTTSTDPASGLQHVFSQGTDITAQLSGGQLSGAIQGRDQMIPSVLGQLDNLAAGLTNSFNTQHAAGYDLTGAKGGNFFTPFTQPSPGSNAGAAANFGVAITDPSQLAASADGTVGSNGNSLALAGVQNQAAINGQNVTDYYSNLVAGVGSQVAGATGQQQAIGLVLSQLTIQRNSVSGVSIDEEAANLVKFQNAYSAAARVVSTVDQMMQTTINMVS